MYRTLPLVLVFFISNVFAEPKSEMNDLLRKAAKTFRNVEKLEDVLKIAKDSLDKTELETLRTFAAGHLKDSLHIRQLGEDRLVFADGKVSISMEIADLKANAFRINGKPFVFTEKKTVSEMLEEIHLNLPYSQDHASWFDYLVPRAQGNAILGVAAIAALYVMGAWVVDQDVCFATAKGLKLCKSSFNPREFASALDAYDLIWKKLNFLPDGGTLYHPYHRRFGYQCEDKAKEFIKCMDDSIANFTAEQKAALGERLTSFIDTLRSEQKEAEKQSTSGQ